VVVDHVCWQLSAAGQSCDELCGGAVNEALTINGASHSDVDVQFNAGDDAWAEASAGHARARSCVHA